MGGAGTGVSAASFEVLIVAAEVQRKSVSAEDVFKMAPLKTSSDETVCQKALLAGAKLKVKNAA